MAPLPKFLCWLDFETTSLDPVTTTVLECFWEVTDWSLNPVASGHGLRWAAVADAIPKMDDFVRDMHTSNGLIDACIGARDAGIPSVADAMHRLVGLLPGLDQPVALAGTGIAHFDRRVIDAQYPAVADRLTYWALDMGPIRRLAEGTGHTDLCLPDPVDGIAHRAEADVRRAQDEYRQWVRVFGWANTGDVQ